VLPLLFISMIVEIRNIGGRNVWARRENSTIVWEETCDSPLLLKATVMTSTDYVITVWLNEQEEVDTWRSRRLQGEKPWRTYFRKFIYTPLFKAAVAAKIKEGF